jgi:sugar lactone lactonase YvrE
MNPDLELVNVIYSGLRNPKGIFVDRFGAMFVADHGNNRIVHLSAAGEVVQVFTLPVSEAVGTAPFAPTGVVVDDTGRIFVIRGEAIMMMDANNDFRGFFGQSRIGFNLTEAILRVVATEAQLRFLSRRLAPTFIDIHLGHDGMIYATSLNRSEGEVKRLNSVGNNTFRTYRDIGDGANPIRNFINNTIMRAATVRRTFRFGEYFDDDGNYLEPIFSGITTDANGIVTIVEELTGRIFQYDQDGVMLAGFAGQGAQVGRFIRPSSIAVDSRGRLFVTDRVGNNFQVFEPTEFILTVHAATTAFHNGLYYEAYELWHQVLEMHENYELAHMGIARIYYRQERWADAMTRARLANDPIWYSRAFEEFRYEVLRANFGLILFLTLAIIVATIFFFKYFGRAVKHSFWHFIRVSSPSMQIGRGILFSFNILRHPVDTLEAVSVHKKRINMAVPLLLFLLVYLVRLFYLTVVHYPLAPIDTANVNIGFEAVRMWFIPLTYVIAAFAVTSIASGESKMKEIFFTASLSLVPFVAINVPMMFISNLLSDAQRGWYGVFGSLATAWMVFILYMSLKVLNDYSWGKALKLSFVTIFVMLVVWLVGGMVYVLSARLVQFIMGILFEFRLAVF